MTSKKERRKPRTKLMLASLIVLVFTNIILWLDGFRISEDGIRVTRNFSVVEENQVYRSAQLTGSELEEVIEQYGIKTIINLQGARPGYTWYDSEELTATKHGVELINLNMSTESIPHREDLIQLLDAFRKSPRPILIHCRSGSDRTGEAAAIYMIDHLGVSPREALKMLSPKFLYFETLAPAKKYFVEQLYKGEQWARTQYNPCVSNYRYRDTRQCSI